VNTSIQSPLAERVRESRLHRSLAGTNHVSAYSRRQLRDLERRWVTRNWRIIAVILGGAAVAAIVAAVVVPTALGDVLAGVVITSGWWSLHTMMIETTGASRHRLGLLGETWTSMELAGRRRRGWRHVNDVLLHCRQTDHVAVGPGGVVVVESKFRNDWAGPDVDLGAMAAQVENQREVLGLHLKLREETRAVVAMWGNRLDEVVGDTWVERDGVVFCRGAALGSYLDSLPNTLDTGQVQVVHRALAHLVRRLDSHDAAVHGPAPRPRTEHVAEVSLLSALGMAALMVLFVPLAWWGPWWGLGAGALIAGVAAAQHGRMSSRRGRARVAVVAGVATWSVAALGAAVLLDAIVT
jgi:hypothetical protein